MSSAARTSRPTSQRVMASMVLGLAVALSGCGTGFETQTDTQVAVVNGASADVGAIDIREAQLAFPPSGRAFYEPGEEAELYVFLVNSGDTADELVSVTSEAASQVVVTGGKELPAHTYLTSDRKAATVAPVTTGATAEHGATTSAAAPSTTTGHSTTDGHSTAPSPTTTSGSSAPTSTSAQPGGTTSAPATPGFGRIKIVLRLNRQVRAGENIPVTFLFRRAGEVTFDVPMAAPDNARISNPIHRAEDKPGH